MDYLDFIEGWSTELRTTTPLVRYWLEGRMRWASPDLKLEVKVAASEFLAKLGEESILSSRLGQMAEALNAQPGFSDWPSALEVETFLSLYDELEPYEFQWELSWVLEQFGLPYVPHEPPYGRAGRSPGHVFRLHKEPIGLWEPERIRPNCTFGEFLKRREYPVIGFQVWPFVSERALKTYAERPNLKPLTVMTFIESRYGTHYWPDTTNHSTFELKDFLEVCIEWFNNDYDPSWQQGFADSIEWCYEWEAESARRRHGLPGFY